MPIKTYEGFVQAVDTGRRNLSAAETDSNKKKASFWRLKLRGYSKAHPQWAAEIGLEPKPALSSIPSIRKCAQGMPSLIR